MEILTESKETRPKEKWKSVEEYILYLKQFAAYKFTKRFVINKKVLEIGCGAGYGADYVSNFASDFVAIDMSKINVSYCQAEYPKDNLIFVMADATKLPFKDDQFGVAISVQVIEHIEPKFVLTYLTEIKRVLKADGIFICSTPNKELRLLPFQKPWNLEHKKEYNCKEFKNLLTKVFGEVKVYGLSASEEVLSIERARVKQDPLKVYITFPLYRLLKVVLPSIFLAQLKEVGKRFISSNRSQNPVQQKDFLTELSPEDFKVDSSCPDDCLDLFGICKKNINPLGEDLNIESYSDYRRIIKGHSSKSLKALYDKYYFTNCVGNKELADRFFITKGLGTTRYTKFPMKLANIQRGDRVLDVGCGRGEIVFQTANLGAISTGIDFSKDAIEIAQSIRNESTTEIINRTNFICCNAEKIDFPDNTFDKIFLLDVVEHVSKDELLIILAEIRRLLKTNGRLIIHSTPNIWSRTYGYWIQAIIHFLSKGEVPTHPFVADLKENPYYFQHINEQSILSLKLFLYRSGFKSKVWLQDSGNPWITRKDLKGRLFNQIFRICGGKYIFGSNLYAIASLR